MIPAARASAASSRVRIVPIPRPWYVVGDRERHLGRSPVANEPRDADRLRVAAEVAHEHVVLGVDPREDPEVMR